ncbi:MAG: OmpA family protein [Paludibacteraceae bacterium]|nr:OmpA family protein [Paludibacteraceae bacterium]
MQKKILLLLLAGSSLLGFSQDTRHILSGEIGLGYSSLLTKSDWGKSSGLVGGNLQVGYELQYNRFLFHTGLEFASVNSLSKLSDFRLPDAPYQLGMTEHFQFTNYKETAFLGQINIPVMFGGLFADRYYFLVGTKIGVPVLHKSSIQSDVKTYLTDEMLIGQLEEARPHDAYASNEKTKSDWKSALPNVQLSAEVGVVLSSFSDNQRRAGKKPFFYRLGLFCDYGITSCGKKNFDAPAGAVPPRDIALNPFVGTSSKLNSLLVGVKFAAQLQLNEPKQAVQPTYLDVTVKDARTGKALACALTIKDEATQRETKVEMRNGAYHKKTRMGAFIVVASANNYYPDTLSYIVSEAADNQRLDFKLNQIPVLSFVVKDAKTGSPLAAEVSFINEATGQTWTTISTSSNGQGTVTLPLQGSYRAHIEVPEHFAYTAPVEDIYGKSVYALEPIIKKRVIVLHNLFFATNQTTILPESESSLQDLYELLNENPEIRIRITGHTDNVGSERDNQILSEGRANSVRQAMIDRGIDGTRIEATGKGESEPIATNDTEEGRAQNRRVEFVVL